MVPKSSVENILASRMFLEKDINIKFFARLIIKHKIFLPHKYSTIRYLNVTLQQVELTHYSNYCTIRRAEWKQCIHTHDSVNSHPHTYNDSLMRIKIFEDFVEFYPTLKLFTKFSKPICCH